ncbi:hypothetical protein E3U43_006301 [Larimichthys crocea]|uniref:Uncharacterized protein n=1 Tax=Larimichthys crocea TaxID=215358 RepID=A0ACD3QNY0_LARCR|nr:hypothetical protein E3U43_006301 [Larimichthys crocea]
MGDLCSDAFTVRLFHIAITARCVAMATTLFVFGGKNEEQDFNDLKVMKLINPSERQPVLTLLGFIPGLTVDSFTPTKVPNVRYELSECVLSNQSRNTPVNAQVSVNRDFSAVRDQAMKMIQAAFTLLNQEFQKLDREKSELSKAAAVLQREKEAHEVHRQQQQQVHHGCIPV